MAPWSRKDKEKDGDLDSQKKSLFGSRSKKSGSPAPAASNPYAVPPPANDPYAKSNANPYASQAQQDDPYMRSQSSLTQPPTSSFGSLSLNDSKDIKSQPPGYSPGNGPAPSRYEKSPVPQGGYGGSQPPPRYQNNGNSYGQAGGYGSDPYGTGSSGSRHGAGGYGGLGRSNSNETMSTDAGRNALFGDAATRRANQPARDIQGQQQSGGASYSNTGGYDSTEMPGGKAIGRRSDDAILANNAT